MTLVEFRDIGKIYDGKTVCQNINLEIHKGEFFTFLGPSGCGKTTLLRILAGFIRPEEGAVFLNGQDITTWPAEKRNVGMVFQNYALFPYMSVYENVDYGLKIKKVPKIEREKKVKKYLKLVNLEGYGNRNVSELSGGEQQRVALARSLVMEPEVLLLDEPLSNLDARLRDKMRTELKEIQSRLGITTIFVTHDQTEALTMSDRIAVFNQGQVIQVGTPNEIYLEPANAFVATFIGDTNLLTAEITNGKALITPHLVIPLSDNQTGRFLSIRPQDIQLSKGQSEQGDAYRGIVESIKINGPLIDYTIRVQDVILKAIRLNDFWDKSLFSVGETLYVTIDPSRIRIFES